jgi:hypothetical protein
MARGTLHGSKGVFSYLVPANSLTGAQQPVAGVQHELAAGLAGGAPGAERAVPAQDAECGHAGAAERHGVPGRAGDRAGLLIDGEVIDLSGVPQGPSVTSAIVGQATETHVGVSLPGVPQ